jgi:hypothetical protein
LHVYDTGTGALLRALEGPETNQDPTKNLVTYQRPSDGRPRIASGISDERLGIWDGDDFSVLHAIQTNDHGYHVQCVAVYVEPTSGRARLVSG